MNPREVIAETARLAAERGWGEDDPQAVYLLNLLSNREDARHHCRHATAQLRNDLDNLEKMLERSAPLLNTLGELQSRPSAVEAAVGQFAAADKALREYLEAFPASNRPEPDAAAERVKAHKRGEHMSERDPQCGRC